VPYDLVAAVGPEAAALVWETGIPGKKIYAALLDPDSGFPHTAMMPAAFPCASLWQSSLAPLADAPFLPFRK
jgi:hypothetical protein